MACGGGVSAGARPAVRAHRLPRREALVHHGGLPEVAASSGVPTSAGPATPDEAAAAQLLPPRAGRLGPGCQGACPSHVSRGALRCWSPMALWSHRCLLQPCSFPCGHHAPSSPSSSAGFGGDCAQGGPGAALAASRVLPEASSAAQWWGSGGGLALGFDPFPDLQVLAGHCVGGDELPVSGEHPSNLAAHQPLPRPCSSRLRQVGLP